MNLRGIILVSALAVTSFCESRIADAGERKWICNAYGTYHDHEEECTRPWEGGTWTIVGSGSDGGESTLPFLNPTNALVLDVARSIEGTYYRKAKLSDRESGIYNCTTYVETVLEKAGFQVTPSMITRLRMNDVAESEIATLVQNKDPKIKGVVTALVDSGQGVRVNARSQLRPGQFVQMWRFNKGLGKYQGHTGIIESIDGTALSLQGAHNSLKKTLTGKELTTGRTGVQTYSLPSWSHVWAVQPINSSSR